MDPPHPKLRLMVSYGGHIVPRPHHQSLFYAGGETRIVAFDRLKAASSYASFTSHLSRTLFKNQPFLLKYQLPDEELDSLISVTSDEDLFNMLEEHDRVSVSALPSVKGSDVVEYGFSGRVPSGGRVNGPVIAPVVRQSRIRLFLFSVKPESVGHFVSGLFDPKTESVGSGLIDLKKEPVGPVGSSLFDPKAVSVGSGLLDPKEESVSSGLFVPKEESGGSDVVMKNGVMGRGEFEGADWVDGLMGLDVGSGVENGGGVPESIVLETNSSFGSSSSSVSMSNLPPIGVQYEDGGVGGLMDKKGRVPSSASIDSDTSIGSSCVLPKPVALQESMRQVASGAPTFTIEPEMTLADPSTMVQLQKTVLLSGYHLPQQLDGKRNQHEVQYIQGSASYIPQYATPLHPPSYYPVYQIPVHQQPNGSNPVNQPYPVYCYRVRPVQSYNTPMYNNVINSQNSASSRPPLHPQTVTLIPPVVYKEILTVQPSPDSAGGFHGTDGSVAPGQSQQLITPLEDVQPSRPLPAANMDITNNSNELDDNIAYTPIYKTQPSVPVVPVLPSHYPVHTLGASVVMSDSSTQHMNVKPLATSHPQ